MFSRWVLRTALEYISECYNFQSKYSTRRVGLPALVHKKMFQWVSSIIKHIVLCFNISSITRDGKNAVKKAWPIMSKDQFLLTLFLGSAKNFTQLHPIL
jgi:hypothetical protein